MLIKHWCCTSISDYEKEVKGKDVCKNVIVYMERLETKGLGDRIFPVKQRCALYSSQNLKAPPKLSGKLETNSDPKAINLLR